MNPLINHFVKRDKEFGEISETLRIYTRQMESLLLTQGIIQKQQYEFILASCAKLSEQAKKKNAQIILIKDQSVNDFKNNGLICRLVI